ncbi:MAG: hypothetical protein WCS86_03520 [Candidatus Paceibacterota bacterium]
MGSRTPKFDEALDKIYENLTPHERKCVICNNLFEINEGDIILFKKLRVPPLDECPECRMRKRMAMMANIFQFYRKNCEEHEDENIISQMDTKNSYKIFDNNFWWDPDAWDAIKYGRIYDTKSSFYDELVKLLHDVPHMAMERFNKIMINSDYTIDSFDVRNCYVSSTIGISENVSYGLWVVYTKDSTDLLRVDHVEHSYDVIDSDRIYKSKYIQNCKNCMNSQFLFDCRNCSDCFMCVNLRNKKYCFFNEQLDRESYLEKIKNINLSKRSIVEEYKSKFTKLIETKAIHRDLWIHSSPGAIGNFLSDCKNCVGVYCASSAKYLLTFYKNENVRYGQDVFGTNDCMDVTIFGPGELCFNVTEGLFSNRVIASYFFQSCRQIEYCFECIDCKYCFGCSGLKKKSYCILNKQYSEDEYWEKVDEIKTKMSEDGIYGKFLSLKDSFFYYHDTYAYAMMPLTKEKAIPLGARWRDYEINIETKDLKVLNSKDVPDNINDVTDDILNSAIICEKTKRPFRITKQELDFYRRNLVPLPVIHPQSRLLERFQKRNPYKILQSNCTNCNKEINTTYDPSRKIKIYCESCYNKEVY